MVSVKIMRSYDYCHFEICLGSEEVDIATNKDALDITDEMRKAAMRLVDKAVEQYKVAQKVEAFRTQDTYERSRLEREVKEIQENFPQSEWTEEQKAKVKAWSDLQHRLSLTYDYEDDFEDW